MAFVLTVLLATYCVARQGPAEAAAVVATTVTVDAGTDLGVLNNPGFYQNISLIGAGDLAKVQEIAPEVARGWGNTQWYYDENTGGYSFNDTTFDQVGGYANRMLVNFDQCDQVLMTPATPQTCREVLKTGIKHHKLRHPELQYIELFNEPDKDWVLSPGENPPLSVDDYYIWYKIGYQIINELNTELAPAVPLRIGGPVAYYFDSTYIQAFLDKYRADPSTAKRLDFISYHQYLWGRQGTPAVVQDEKAKAQKWLTDRNLSSSIPVYVTEYGVFAGGTSGATFGTPTTLQADQLTQAAAMATIGNYYVRGNLDMPMHWVYDHDNDRKSMFVDAVDGAVLPYFNVVKMQRMLKTRRVFAESSSLTADGIGVNAMGSKDDSGIAVLATNYQWINGTATHSVSVNVKNLPSSFTGRQIRVDRYLVDATTSNFNADPAKADLQRVEHYVLPVGVSALPKTFSLSPNAVSLIVLTPVGYAEGEALPVATSAGDTQTDIEDTAASGGHLNLFGGNAVGDYVRYTVTAPATATYRITARMKRTPTRGIVQADLGGKPIAGQVDLYSSGYDFVDVDLGTHTLAAGTTTLTFTLAGSTGGGYFVGLDWVEFAPVTAYKVEAETRVPDSASGSEFYPLTETAASAGGYVKVITKAPGDSIRFTVMVPRPGSYRLVTGVKVFPSRGTCQWSVDGVPVGSPQDQYAATAAYWSMDVGRIEVQKAGNMTFACTVTGKNAASADYDLAMDYLLLQPASDL